MAGMMVAYCAGSSPAGVGQGAFAGQGTSCVDVQNPLAAKWKSHCGNGICEIDEAASNCLADCRETLVDKEPLVLHGAPAPEHLRELQAAVRLIIRGEAMQAGSKTLAAIDQQILKLPHSIIITAVSNTEAAGSGFRYCLPKGNDLHRWLTFIRYAVERYDGDDDPGCIRAAPDCYDEGDGAFPGAETMAALKTRPVTDWQVENEWFWQVEDCSSGSSAAPTPRFLADHLAAMTEVIRLANPKARIILGAIESLQHHAALQHSISYNFIETGNEDCTYRKVILENTQTAPAEFKTMEANLSVKRAEMVEVLRLCAAYFDVLDVHHYGANPYGLLYEAATARQLLRDAGITHRPLWTLENAGPFFFFPLMNQAAPTECPPVPKSLSDARKTGISGAYDDQLLAEFVAKHYAIGLHAGFGRVAWSSLVPTIGWTENFLRTSLLDYNYNEKPAYNTYRLLAGILGKVKKIDKPLPQAYRFTLSGGGAVLLVWSDHCSGTVDVSKVLGTGPMVVQPVVPSASGDFPVFLSIADSVPVSQTPALVKQHVSSSIISMEKRHEYSPLHKNSFKIPRRVLYGPPFATSAFYDAGGRRVVY